MTLDGDQVRSLEGSLTVGDTQALSATFRIALGVADEVTTTAPPPDQVTDLSARLGPARPGRPTVLGPEPIPAT